MKLQKIEFLSLALERDDVDVSGYFPDPHWHWTASDGTTYRWRFEGCKAMLDPEPEWRYSFPIRDEVDDDLDAAVVEPFHKPSNERIRPGYRYERRSTPGLAQWSGAFRHNRLIADGTEVVLDGADATLLDEDVATITARLLVTHARRCSDGWRIEFVGCGKPVLVGRAGA